MGNDPSAASSNRPQTTERRIRRSRRLLREGLPERRPHRRRVSARSSRPQPEPGARTDGSHRTECSPRRQPRERAPVDRDYRPGRHSERLRRGETGQTTGNRANDGQALRRTDLSWGLSGWSSLRSRRFLRPTCFSPDWSGRRARSEAARLFEQGRVLMQRGENAEAIERIKDAIAIERGNRDYLRTLAQAQLAAGRTRLTPNRP